LIFLESAAEGLHGPVTRNIIAQIRAINCTTAELIPVRARPPESRLLHTIADGA
jgi:hypothetical protein